MRAPSFAKRVGCCGSIWARGSYEEFHPYGTTAVWTASASVEVSGKRYRYTGMERDEETGLQYHSARYYAAWLGRWTAVDPSGVRGGLNQYRYGADDPVNKIDRSGCAPVKLDDAVSAATSDWFNNSIKIITSRNNSTYISKSDLVDPPQGTKMSDYYIVTPSEGDYFTSRDEADAAVSELVHGPVRPGLVPYAFYEADGYLIPTRIDAYTAPNLYSRMQAAMSLEQIELDEIPKRELSLLWLPGQGLEASAAEAVFSTIEGLTAREAAEAAARRRAAQVAARDAAAARAAARVLPGLTAGETAVVREAQAILGSAEMEILRTAARTGQEAEVTVGGRLIQYIPNGPFSGFTNFETGGFAFGRDAFASKAELAKTVLHELYRLSTSKVTEGASRAMVTAETAAAYNFAEKALKYLVPE